MEIGNEIVRSAIRPLPILLGGEVAYTLFFL